MTEYNIINLKIFYTDNKKNQYNYLDFFKTISKYKDKIDVTTTFSALIETINFYHRDSVVAGQIIYGSNIKKLYDTNKKEELPEGKLVEFKDKLANNKRVEFIFIPECHRMVIKNNININSVQKIFNKILIKYMKKENMDNLVYDIVIEQSKDNLQKLLKMDLKKLNIYFTCTNSDNVSDEFAKLFDKDTKDSGAKEVQVSYIAERKKDSYLKITDNMRAISELAIRNGKVDVTAVEEGKSQKHSTTSMPEIINLPDEGNNMELKTEKIRDILLNIYKINQNE